MSESTSLTERECQLLNHSVIQSDQLRFLHPDSTAANPKFLSAGEDPIPVYKARGCAIYAAVFNRLPVMVKEVELTFPLRYFRQDAKFYPTQLRQLREIVVGLTLPRHGNLCQVLAWARSPKPNHLLIVIERFDDDLDRYLVRLSDAKKKKEATWQPSAADGGVLGWESFFLVATELASALEKLSNLERGWPLDGDDSKIRESFVVHRDLKLANLFLVFHEALKSSAAEDPIPRIKTVAVGDFGLARIEDSSEISHLATRGLGTITYQAPELIDPDRFKSNQLTPKLDIFTFGVILWKLLHYPLDLEKEVIRKCEAIEGRRPNCFGFDDIIVKEGGRALPIDPSVPEDLKDILLKCCQVNPTDRPSASEVRQALIATTKCQEHFKPSEVVRTVTNASSGILLPMPEPTVTTPQPTGMATAANEKFVDPSSVKPRFTGN